MAIEIRSERLTAEAYIEFLTRTDLGSQYPAERFEERIARLVQHADVSLTARDEKQTIVGVCFGITDFAYWLFVTDLGIDRRYVRQGLGRQLLQRALEAAGGEKDIVLYTCANSGAVPFYERFGMVPSTDVMEYNRVEWTDFEVN